MPGRSWRGRRRRSHDLDGNDDDHDHDDNDGDDHDNDDDGDDGEYDTGEDDGDGDEMVVLVKVRMTRKELMAAEIGWLGWLVELGTILGRQKSCWHQSKHLKEHSLTPIGHVFADGLACEPLTPKNLI